jgi:hypothetical protein
MLKKSSSFVSHRTPRKVGDAGSEAQRTEAYASLLRSLRLAGKALLNILHARICDYQKAFQQPSKVRHEIF